MKVTLSYDNNNNNNAMILLRAIAEINFQQCNCLTDQYRSVYVN